jgi:hypothetical protein
LEVDVRVICCGFVPNNLKIVFRLGLLMLFAPFVATGAFARSDFVKPLIDDQKVIVGDEVSDALTTASVTPKTSSSCSAGKLDTKSRGLKFDMSAAFSKPISATEEPSP